MITNTGQGDEMNNEEYITIELRLLTDAAMELAPWLRYEPTAFKHAFKQDEVAEVRRGLVDAIATYIEDSEPFCDHAVGICACGPRAVLEDLRHVLAGSLRCRTCGGDGYLPVLGDSVTEGSVEGPGGLVLEPYPGSCPMCKGTGWVKA